MEEDYEYGYFDGWIPCYYKLLDDGGTDIIGSNWLFELLITLWVPIAALRPEGFLIKSKKK